MAQIQTLLSEQSGTNSSLPENNQISSSSKTLKTLSPGAKVAINVGIQIARQYGQKVVTDAAGLYGNSVLQNNIGEASKLVSYGAQIATTGWVGVAAVGAEIAYTAVMNGIKDTQARNKAEYTRDTVGYIATGAGKYNE